MTAFEIRDLGLADKNAACACCGPGDSGTAVVAVEPESAPAEPRTVVTDYLVEGMTCAHCVRSVTEEISGIPGVAEVNIDLNSGGVSRVSVASDVLLDAAQVRAAVEEAGYALATIP